MSKKHISNNFRTWVEISREAIRHNLKVFRSIVGRKSRLWGVVKSNAYGHGLLIFPELLEKEGIDGFCVDSVVEGFRLRHEGIKKPVLVLGYTLPTHLLSAAEEKITVSVASRELMEGMGKLKNPPEFHLKVDTGMHRQGFYPEELDEVFHRIGKNLAMKNKLTGMFTHFSAAKDITYPGYTENQFKKFNIAVAKAKNAGFKNLIFHAAATGGTLLGDKYHLDAVRIGIGLYGLHPSKEFEIQRPDITLKPVLAWKTIVCEVKKLKKGSYVGYDLTERVTRDTKAAVLPIGYWHGFPRILSGTGEVLVKGKRARVLGRVSMDLIVVDATDMAVEVGDEVIIIGKDRKDEINAYEAALKAGTTPYEFLTRINPLIERVSS